MIGKTKKILILGSEGQIGTSLETHLKKKYIVTGIDILNHKSEDLRSKNSKIEILIKNTDFVFFLAFDVGGSRYLKRYQKTYNFLINNLFIMANVFKLLNKYKKKFIFASSQMSNMDFSPYGTLKRLGEDLTESLNGVYVKFWNVYGIEKDLGKSHVITDFILMGLKNKKINMLTSGNESREFLYADDCSMGLSIIMNKFNYFFKKKNELHLTTSKKIKIIDIAKIIKKILSKRKINISIKPSDKKDVLQNNINNEANKFLLRYWKPKTSIEGGVEKIVNYYENI